MSQYRYKLEEAQTIAKQLKKGLETAGPRYFSAPYSDIQLVEVITVLNEAYDTLVKTSAEEIALANRRYAAANARATKQEKNG
jgi:hypothetical protein